MASSATIKIITIVGIVMACLFGLVLLQYAGGTVQDMINGRTPFPGSLKGGTQGGRKRRRLRKKKRNN